MPGRDEHMGDVGAVSGPQPEWVIEERSGYAGA